MISATNIVYRLCTAFRWDDWFLDLNAPSTVPWLPVDVSCTYHAFRIFHIRSQN